MVRMIRLKFILDIHELIIKSKIDIKRIQMKIFRNCLGRAIAVLYFLKRSNGKKFDKTYFRV